MDSLSDNKKRKCGYFRKLLYGMSAFLTVASITAVTAFAEDLKWENLNLTDSAAEGDVGKAFGKAAGVLIAIAQYIGVALIVFGVYEVVMSFLQSHTETKVKGIVTMVSGAILTSLATVLKEVGLIS